MLDLVWRHYSCVPGDSNYLSQHFRHAAGLSLFEAKGTCWEDVEVGHKLNSQKCVCMGGRCLQPTSTWEVEPSYILIEEGRWKTLYSTQIHVSSGPMLTHAIPQPLPAPNIRMLAAMSTLRPDAGGLCPDLSSHREACLEVSSHLSAFLWQ